MRLPRSLTSSRRFGAGRVGVAVGRGTWAALPSVRSASHSQHPFFLAGQVSRKSFVVLPVPNTTELQLMRKGMKRNSTRAGAAKVHTPLLTCRLSGSPAVLVLYVSRGPTCRLRGPSPLLTLLAIALLTDAVVLETSLQWRVDCFIFSLLKEKTPRH